MTGWTLTSPSAEADARARETDGDERGDSPTPRGVWGAIFEAIQPRVVVNDGRRYVCGDGGDSGLWEQISEADRQNAGWLGSYSDCAGGGPCVDDGASARPIRALSLMAGYGCDASELRKLAVKQGWPIRITGVELCEARREHLEQWCDGVACMDWRDFLTSQAESEFTPDGVDGYDIIVGNPAFSHTLRSGKVWSDTARSGRGGWVDTPFRPVDETMVPTLLEHAPAVLLLHREQAFTKSETGREVLRRYPPAASWRIGPASFDISGKMDSCCYLASLWLRGHDGPTAAHTLRELTASERRWTVPPGSETPSAELPAQPGWSP